MLELLVMAALVAAPVDTVQQQDEPTVITLDQAIRIALSENESVKIADKEITRTQYARKGTYAALFPQIDGSGSASRTIQKQRVYMDIPGMEDGMEMGKYNSYSFGFSAAMPLVNAQLWESLKISGQEVELAVEKARSSRLEMVTQVKEAYLAVLLAREVRDVYKQVYDNAVMNYQTTEMRYNAQKSSELDLMRAKTTVANAVPNVYDSESSIDIALWQLKAVMGLSLDENIDVTGSLNDYSVNMYRDLDDAGDANLDGNSSLKQLAIQAEELASTIKLKQNAYIPTLSIAYSYSYSANNDTFQDFKWSPYSYVGLSLSIPIFSGTKRLQDVRQAKVQATELELQRQSTERQLKIAISQYVKTMENGMNTYYSSKDAVESAQKAYDISQQSYAVGRSTLTDLNGSQLALVQAQLSVSQAIYSFMVAKSELEEVLGRDFEN